MTAKVGQVLTLHIHDRHVVADLSSPQAATPARRFVTGPLQFATPERSSVIMWTPDGEQTYPTERGKSALTGTKEGHPITVELNSQGGLRNTMPGLVRQTEPFSVMDGLTSSGVAAAASDGVRSEESEGGRPSCAKLDGEMMTMQAPARHRLRNHRRPGRNRLLNIEMVTSVRQEWSECVKRLRATVPETHEAVDKRIT